VKDSILHGVLGGKSRRSNMAVVENTKHQAWYLSGYLSRVDFERYYFSGGWVFAGWIDFLDGLRRSLAIIREERCWLI
jgi:hypothetical protein